MAAKTGSTYTAESIVKIPIANLGFSTTANSIRRLQ